MLYSHVVAISSQQQPLEPCGRCRVNNPVIRRTSTHTMLTKGLRRRQVNFSREESHDRRATPAGAGRRLSELD